MRFLLGTLEKETVIVNNYLWIFPKLPDSVAKQSDHEDEHEYSTDHPQA